MNHNSWIIIADEVPSGVLASMARQTGGVITAVVAGSRKCAEAAASGADHVIWCPAEDSTPAEAWTDAIAEAAARAQPRMILAANLPISRAIAGAAAVGMKAAITSSVVSVSLNGERAEVTRLVADGRAVEVLDTEGAVVGIIMEGGEEGELSGNTAEITLMEVEKAGNKLKITGTWADGGGADLAHADRVVGAGAGIGSKDNIKLVEKLAEAFQAEIACSLPLCDNYRWFEHSRVVGSSTQNISPRIYLMVGISGQPQHMMGVRGAKTIIAVNHDPEALVFKKCHYGIVGDLNNVVPALTAALDERQRVKGGL